MAYQFFVREHGRKISIWKTRPIDKLTSLHACNGVLLFRYFHFELITVPSLREAQEIVWRKRKCSFPKRLWPILIRREHKLCVHACVRIFRCNLQHFSREARYFYKSENGTSIQLTFSSYFFQQDLFKRENKQSFTHQVYSFRSSQKHLEHAFGILAKHCGNRSQNACPARSLSREFCRRLLLVFLTLQAHIVCINNRERKKSFDILMLMFASQPSSLGYKLLLCLCIILCLCLLY